MEVLILSCANSPTYYKSSVQNVISPLNRIDLHVDHGINNVFIHTCSA